MRRGASVVVVWLAFTALAASGLAQNVPPSSGDQGAGAQETTDQEAPLHDRQYRQALELRAKAGTSRLLLQEVAVLLVASAGLRAASSAGERSSQGHLLPTPAGKSSKAAAAAAAANYDASRATPLPGFSSIVLEEDSTHPGALRELAKAYQDGLGLNQHQRLALELFRLASDQGDPEAQGQMAMRYALGLDHADSWDADGIVQFDEPDTEAAVLHYYFAALGGDQFSRMALGYRHLYGLGVPRSCWTAAKYYQGVAQLVTDLSTQPGTLPHIERIRLHVQATQGMKADRHKEVVQYYQYSADRGNVDAQTAVGQVLNYGTHGVQRDHEAAHHYLQRAAEAGDVEATAHLGHMHANGFGTPKDLVLAQMYFARAAKENNPSAMFGLGFMLLTGHGMPQDYDKAFKYFSQAAEQGQADAHFYLGVMHLQGMGVRRKSVQRAFPYFQLAGHAGHSLAMYNAAMMHLAGKGTARACKPAVALLKTLSERGPLAAVLQLGHEHFFKGEYSSALLNYLMASEMGMEVGQSNAAWMLSRGYVVPQGPETAVSMFSWYQRSAEQGNVHSLLQLGDSYFYGTGTKQDWVRSATVYYEAYQDRSAEAMFNLGFMHEFGAGVPQDLILARKFFNMAVHTQPDAYAAASLAKAWLSAHEVWLWLRPHLPSRLEHLTRNVLVLQAPHTSVLGSWTHSMQALMPSQLLVHTDVLMGRWADAVGLSGMSGWGGGDSSELGESAILLGLVLILYFVLKIRRRRAIQRAQVGAAPAVPPAQAAEGAAT